MCASPIIPSYAADKVILIEGNKKNGLGDISATFKIAALLKSQGVPVPNIIISLDNVKDAELFNREGFTIIPSVDRAKVARVGLQIFFPGIKGYVHPDVPILEIEEYDRDPSMATAAAGGAGARFHHVDLGLSHVGLLIDMELRDFMRGAPSIEIRAAQLLHTSPLLRECLLGKEGGEEEKVRHFVEKKRLYVGHMSSFKTVFSFIGALAKLNAGDPRDIHICLTKGKESLPSLIPFLRAILKDSDIGRIVVQSWDTASKTYISEEISIGDRPKALTLTLGPILQEDMRCLWKASEKETVVTGDQSLSEAISSYKSFIYEGLVHKMHLARHLTDLYLRHKTEHAPGTIVVMPSLDPESLFAIFSALRSEDHRSMLAFDEDILTHHDCTDALTTLFKSLF